MGRVGGGIGAGKGTGKSMRKLCRNYPLAVYPLVSPLSLQLAKVFATPDMLQRNFYRGELKVTDAKILAILPSEI